MKNKEDILILVQARLSSTRVPQKMIKPFADTTLVDILFDKLSKSTVLPQNNIWASLYDSELCEIAQRYNLNIYNRSKESAEENYRAEVIHEWINQLDYKYMILVSACNPLLKLETIEKFYIDFLESDKDGSFGVFGKKQYYWDKNFNMIQNYDPNDKIFDTNKVDPLYEAAHCLYGSRVDFIRQGYFMDNKFPPDVELFVMDEFETFDIDYPWQFEVGEVLYRKFEDSL